VCLNVLNRVKSFAVEARPVTARLVKDLFSKLTQLALKEDDLRTIFSDKERLVIFTQTVAKYNLFLSQLDVHQLTADPADAQA